MALTFGNKPNSLEFLKPTIEIIKNILHTCVSLNGEVFKIVIGFITCDAPAKAFVKGIKQFNAKAGCDKCKVIGVSIEGSTVFKDLECERRTDYGFRRHIEDNHHNTTSPFTELPIDMVKAFNVDYMHCALLGVMKNLLKIYLGMCII